MLGETDGTFSGEASACGIDGCLVEIATLALQRIEDLIEAVQALFDADALGKGEANAAPEMGTGSQPLPNSNAPFQVNSNVGYWPIAADHGHNFSNS